ncbi:MAG: preprotein translocase subunit SecG [Muribaculaceae bacterium]|nr:preprotein translocase subunit SecG [Muribaculaceae bacterium]MDE5929936.1 preprotein translocase subunit SecG [Muribaculaceae bacterium]MDE6130523.1 preprotein translocase subunit SecG [Muribaculaceae bacterium]
MYLVLSIITILVAVLLIGIVLIQKSKGGGLSSQFGGAGNVMGVRQTNSFLEKATWTLAALIVVLSIASSFSLRSESKADTRFSAPAAPAPAAATTTDAPAAPAAPATPAN